MADFDELSRLLDELTDRCGGELHRGQGKEFERFGAQLVSAINRSRRGAGTLLASGKAVLNEDAVRQVAQPREVAFPDGRTAVWPVLRMAELAALLCYNYKTLNRLKREGLFPWPVVAARLAGRFLPGFVYTVEEVIAVVEVVRYNPRALNGLARASNKETVAAIFAAVEKARRDLGIPEPYCFGRGDPAKLGAAFVSALLDQPDELESPLEGEPDDE